MVPRWCLGHLWELIWGLWDGLGSSSGHSGMTLGSHVGAGWLLGWLGWGPRGESTRPGDGNGLVWEPGGRLQRGVLRLRISDFRTPVS